VFTTFTILKFVHILMAIIAVGFNASYGVWLARAARDPEHEEWAVAGVKVLDDRFANPAYGLLLVTGLIMVGISYPRITDLWIILALILYAVAVVLGAAFYTPLLKKQKAMLADGKRDSDDYRRLANRGRSLGILLAVDVVAIVFLMVTKPTL
jgi:uncharacterized membrane protein